MAIDTRREVNNIWRHYARFQKDIGESAVWFQFDTANTRYNAVYDEGERTYLQGIEVPIMWVDQVEDPEQYTESGRRPTQRLRFAVSTQFLMDIGISTVEVHGNRVIDEAPAAPEPAQPGRPASPWLDDRLNDIVYYDSRFYSISNFQIRGRAKGQDVIIGVSCIEHDPDDEFIMDKFPWDRS